MNGLTLLFADMVASTAHAERMGTLRASQWWAHHDRVARDLLASCGGKEIDRADGFFLLFDSPDEAARYALAYRRALEDMGAATRIGLHVGEVVVRENSMDDVMRGAKRFEVDGIAKPLAARLMALASGGQTLMSKSAAEAIGGAFAADVVVVDHGHYRLKGISEPVPVFELGVAGKSPLAPPPDTEKSYQVIRFGGDWLPVRDVPHTLPAERDSFVGRMDELQALARRLDAGARLITVLGPGGTGKTRFVVHYGWTWLGDWVGGICFCDLSEARTVEGILSVVSIALGVPLDHAHAEIQLGHAIDARGRCLVVLDNFEQVAQHAEATLGVWLDRCAAAHFLVTSRERLRLAGEEILALEPLPLEDAAIELFIRRAMAHHSGFRIDEQNRADVAEVVRLVDGLPLAIELAAARIRILSPLALVERMRDRFSLLSGVRSGVARQATLRAAIDWSWDLLSASEQVALAQCAVFEGPFTLAAAATVLDLSNCMDAPSVLDTMQSLVDKSLLRHWPGEPTRRLEIDEPYFGMYVSIHEYAAARLHADSERAVQVRHGAYFARFGTDASIAALRQHGGTRRWLELATELDDIVQACRRAIARRDAYVAVATFRAAAEVLEQQGPMTLASSLAEDVLRITTLDDAQRAAVGLRYGVALWQLGSTAKARTQLQTVLALCRERGLRRLEGRTLTQLATIDWRQFAGSDTQCLEALRSSVDIARETGDRQGEGAALVMLAKFQSDLGLVGDVAANLAAALAIQRDIGDRAAEAIALGSLAARALDAGDFADALRNFEAALALHRQVGSKRSASTELLNLGTLHFREGRLDEAERCYREALENDRAVGARAHEAMVLTTLVLVHDARGDDAQALACCEQALTIARGVGRPSLISYALTNLGGLYTQTGRIDEARRAFQEAEPIERGSGRLQLGKFLCMRGIADAAAGDRDAASQALAEAEAIGAEVGAGPGSPLQVVIAELREAIAR